VERELTRYRFAPSAARSLNMRRITSKNTKPELMVRSTLRTLGHTGYRLHRADVPGKPDIVFVGKKIAIFVHGCFWHRHSCAVGQRVPKTNVDYWGSKIDGNVRRDRRHRAALRETNWRVLVLWECETKETATVVRKIRTFLATPRRTRRSVH